MQKRQQIQQDLSTGFAFHQAGDIQNAAQHYKRVLANDPRNIDASRMLGVICFEHGNPQEAVRLITLSLQGNPQQPHLHNILGLALHALQRYDDALANFDRALTITPNDLHALTNRGVTLAAVGRYEEALASYSKALPLAPNDGELHFKLGFVLQQMNRYDDAIDSYTRAIALLPSHVSALNNKGNVLSKCLRFEEAIVCYEQAIALSPDIAIIHNNKGDALRRLDRYYEALACYKTGFSLAPDTPYLLGIIAHTQMYLCHWQGIDGLFENLAKAIEDGKPASTPFEVLSTTPLSMSLQKRCAVLYIQDKFPSRPVPLWKGEAYTHERIRIGYFSADFYNHATSYLMAQLIERHDRAQFEVFAFSFGPPSNDAMRTRLEAAFEHFVDVRTKSDHEIAALARQMEIDIAIDLKGLTGDLRTGIFAYRPASVQVSYLGYPGTMGASYIDYIVADAVVIPEHHRSFYSEHIAYLPHSYQVNDSSRRISETVPTRSQVGLPEQGFVFCCFNNSYKITPPLFDIWMRLLLSVPGSVLWLLEGTQASNNNLCREAEARGVASSRLVFAERMELADHLARQRLADLFLDTLPCNAHTTASDALWAGLPVLTCLGETFAGRVAASLLTAIDLPELITDSLQAYESLAIELATQPQKLAAVRKKLADHKNSKPLFDSARFTRDLENAYRHMWKRSHERLEPVDFHVTASI